MLRFEQHTKTKWNIFRDNGKVYIGSFWTGDGTRHDVSKNINMEDDDFEVDFVAKEPTA